MSSIELLLHIIGVLSGLVLFWNLKLRVCFIEQGSGGCQRGIQALTLGLKDLTFIRHLLSTAIMPCRIELGSSMQAHIALNYSCEIWSLNSFQFDNVHFAPLSYFILHNFPIVSKKQHLLSHGLFSTL